MRVKSLLVFTLFTVHSILYGQIEEEIERINSDSLLQVLPILDGTERIDALNQIAFDLSRDNPDSCIAISYRANQISENIDYQKGIADARLNLGVTYLFQDSLKSSIIHFLNALQIYENIDTCLGMGLVYFSLSVINQLTGRYNISVAYGRKAYDVYNTLQLGFYKVFPLQTNGLTCTYNKDFDSSKYYNEQGLALLKKYPDAHYEAGFYLNMGFNLAWENLLLDSYINSIQDQINFYSKAIDISERINDSIVGTISLFNLAYKYYELGTEEGNKKFEETLFYLIEYGEIRKIHPQPLVGAYRIWGIYEYDKGNISKAIFLTEKAIRRGKVKMDEWTLKDFKDPYNMNHIKIWYKISLRRCYDQLIKYYKETGDYNKALEYHMLKVEIEEYLTQQENKDLLIILETDYENEKTRNKLALFARDKELSELRTAQSRNLNIGIGVIFLILVLVGILFIRQSKLKNEHKSTLLEQKLLRLQMNPHFIFNALSNIMHAIEEDGKQSALSYLSKFSKLLRTNLESSRQDYILLEDEITSIAHYLELQQLRYEDKFDFCIETEEGIDLENAIIPPMLIQPFIENAIEHGIRHKEEKGNITIRFSRKGEKIHCEIEDDGVGREKAWETELKHKEYKSLATDIIRDRMAVLNKKLKQKISLNITDLKSDTDDALGTLVRLDLPYLLD